MQFSVAVPGRDHFSSGIPDDEGNTRGHYVLAARGQDSQTDFLVADDASEFSWVPMRECRIVAVLNAAGPTVTGA